MTLILVGNEKGGSRKSTVALHLALAFLVLGRRVARVDLDSRQQTMTRFFSDRAMFAERHRLAVASKAALAGRMIDRERFPHGLGALESEATGFEPMLSHRAALAEAWALTRSVAAIKRQPAVAV